MQYNAPYGSTDPNASYVNGNPATGTAGSVPPAASIEADQREIVNAITQSGQTPNGADNTQLWKAVAIGVQNNLFRYAVAGGIGDAFTIATSPPATALTAGQTILVYFGTANVTTAPTLTRDGLGTFPILKSNGTAPSIGDITGWVELICDGAHHLCKGPVASDVPHIATGTVTLYVRTDGNDNNNGSANTPAAAFATIGAAVAYGTQRYALSGNSLIIQLGIAGTYAAPTGIYANGQTVIIQGNTAAQASYIISGSGTTGLGMIVISSGNVSFIGVTLKATNANAGILRASNAAQIYCQYVTFASTVTLASPFALVFASAAAGVVLDVGCIYSASAAFLWFAQNGGVITMLGNQTISGAPTYSSSTVAATGLGVIATATSGPTWTGSCTGARYNSNANSLINTNGAGASFYPGSAAGVTSTGGLYA